MTDESSQRVTLITELKARSEAELLALMERLGIKIDTAISREQLEELNRLFWAVWFTLQEKGAKE